MTKKRKRKKIKKPAKKRTKNSSKHSEPEDFNPLAQSEYVESNRHAFDPHEQGSERKEPERSLPLSALDKV